MSRTNLWNQYSLAAANNKSMAVMRVLETASVVIFCRCQDKGVWAPEVKETRPNFHKCDTNYFLQKFIEMGNDYAMYTFT